MAAHLGGRRGTKPKLGKGDGAQVVSVSKLQELRSATVASPCRWQRAVEKGKDVDERAAHALGVEHDILVEEPPLQGIATLAALTL